MTIDPRKEPGWKQKRYEDRNLAMLGAILDALLVKPEVPPVAPTQPRPRARNAG